MPKPELCRQIRRRSAFSYALPILFALCGAASAGDLTGVWSGTVASTSGENAPVELTFSEADCLIMQYADKSGQTRSAELAEAGQTIQYVPRGGGVKTHVVQSIDHASDGLSFVLATSFERAQNGYLQQDSIVETYEFTLGPDGLTMRLTSMSANRFGDSDLTAAGGGQSASEGVLQRKQ